MSEEILKALTQLFAIITKQDGGVTEKERQFVIGFFQQELDQDSIKEYLTLYDGFVGYTKKEEPVAVAVMEPKKEKKLTSVRDSVKTLAICKKINKTLTQKQKAVVLIKILELVGSDKNFTPQRMEIIDTVSTVFNIDKDEFKLIEAFVLQEEFDQVAFDGLLSASKQKNEQQEGENKHLLLDINGEITFLKVKSVDMYFVKYIGSDEVVLNGFTMKSNHVYLFSHGSTIKTPLGAALYYSDLVSNFVSGSKINKVSFNARNIQFRFPNGGIGLRDVNISEGPGKLIGIMGASGAGKTTLLNVLAGIEEPSEGAILINGFDIHKEKEKIEGVIGYVSQDDLLIEELTVYQNLYYNAKLCFGDLKEEDLDKKVLEVLSSLGLEQRKDLKVGNVLDKTISGGQRKRLNIALELIREPAVLFVDEPTSGLSSRDSENVIDLLKELSLRGKLIFVVIHQPSSDIYKMFDKMFIMDTGGYPIFYGHPVEAITYFKKATNQVDSERGQCMVCGNVNPEQIFNIIEANVVDEYGQFTNKRKVNPQQWHEQFREKFNFITVEDLKEAPPATLKIPTRFKQLTIFATRDLLSKISNKQYLLINLLEAPLLAMILAFVIRYQSGSEGYVFRFNENIPAYLMMSIVVALFMGLSVSAEEIIRDRKILKREAFLNLSWSSYLSSKLAILFLLSAIQTLTFVLIGNSILEIKGMTLSFWLVLFSVSCFANILGLNVSSAFNSAVTVYIIIPLLLIPQMVLSGLMFPFNKLNDLISEKGDVPIVADMMASRWALEAMVVDQYASNAYEAPFFDLETKEKSADFRATYLISTLQEKLRFVRDHYGTKDDSVKKILARDFKILKDEISREEHKESLESIDLDKVLTVEGFNAKAGQSLEKYFEELSNFYRSQFNDAVAQREKMIYFFENNPDFDYNLNDFKNKYHNESLSDLVRNLSVKERIVEHEGRLLQQMDPIFNSPDWIEGPLDYRAHFLAPEKHFLNSYFNTYNFNVAVIWLMTLALFVTLYYELFRHFLGLGSRLKMLKRRKK